MAENKIKEVAQLLGLELEEEFRLEGASNRYKLTKDGLMWLPSDSDKWYFSVIINELILGKYKIIKLPKPILDDVEREYLGNIIKPFRDRVIYIAKAETVKTYSPNAKVYECIYIMYKDGSKKQNPV